MRTASSLRRPHAASSTTVASVTWDTVSHPNTRVKVQIIPSTHPGPWNSEPTLNCIIYYTYAQIEPGRTHLVWCETVHISVRSRVTCHDVGNAAINKCLAAPCDYGQCHTTHDLVGYKCEPRIKRRTHAHAHACPINSPDIICPDEECTRRTRIAALMPLACTDAACGLILSRFVLTAVVGPRLHRLWRR